MVLDLVDYDDGGDVQQVRAGEREPAKHLVREELRRRTGDAGALLNCSLKSGRVA